MEREFLAAQLTSLPHFGMPGLANRLLDAALEDGGMRGPLGGMFPADLPVPSFADALAPLSDKLPKVEPSKGQLAKMAWKRPAASRPSSRL